MKLLLRAGLLVSAGNIVEILAVFVRNVILARLLSIQDFGIAATFALLVSLIDMAQYAGLNRMVVQASDADDPRLQATLHSVQLGLGLIAAALLLLMAWPFATFMGSPDLAWVYALLALVPLLRGVIHLDAMRMQRRGQFMPSVIRQTAPALAALLVIYPAYLWLGDYRVALVVIYAQQIALVLASHLAVEWRYALGFNREIMRRAIAFGWPLMVNSLLFYFIVNGDRLIVSNQFGVEALAWFSAATLLTMMPMNFVAKTMQTVLLPSMAEQQDNFVGLQRQYELTVSVLALVAVGFVATLTLFAGPILTLTFGPKFLPAAPYLALLAAMQGIRLIRTAPALAAMAKAETKSPLHANTCRIIFILLSFIIAIVTGSILSMMIVGIVGEVFAGTLLAYLTRRSTGLSSRHVLIVLFLSACLMGVIVTAYHYPSAIILLIPASGFFLYSVRNFLPYAKAMVRKFQRSRMLIQ